MLYPPYAGTKQVHESSLLHLSFLHTKIPRLCYHVSGCLYGFGHKNDYHACENTRCSWNILYKAIILLFSRFYILFEIEDKF